MRKVGLYMQGLHVSLKPPLRPLSLPARQGLHVSLVHARYVSLEPPLHLLSLPARSQPSGSRRGSRSGPEDEEHAEMLLALEVGESVDDSAAGGVGATRRRTPIPPYRLPS